MPPSFLRWRPPPSFLRRKSEPERTPTPQKRVRPRVSSNVSQVVALLGAAAKHLDPADPRVAAIAETLVDALTTAQEAEVEKAPAPVAAKPKKKAILKKTGAAAIMGGGGSTLKKNPFASRGPSAPRLGAKDLIPRPRAPPPGMSGQQEAPKKKKRSAGEAGIAAVADGLARLAKAMKKPHADAAGALVDRLVNAALDAAQPATRRAAAYGLAACVSGLGIGCLKQRGVVARLDAALAEETVASRHGALACVERLAARLGVLFEPYPRPSGGYLARFRTFKRAAFRRPSRVTPRAVKTLQKHGPLQAHVGAGTRSSCWSRC